MPEELLEPRVPGVGQVLDREPAGQELLLELEAEDHVQPVARLVGIDPDERAADAVHRAVEVLERDVAERPGTTPARAGRTSARTEATVRRRSPRACSATRGASRDAPSQSGVRSSVGLDAPLVEAVTALVHRGEEREEVVVGVAAREADVAEAERDLERMDRRVEPELVPGRAEPLDELARERVLRARSGTGRA